MAGWTGLPGELQVRILEHLDYADLHRLSRVSKPIRRQVLESSSHILARSMWRVPHVSVSQLVAAQRAWAYRRQMLHEYDDWDTPLTYHPLIQRLYRKMTACVPYESLKCDGKLIHEQSAARQNATYPPCSKMYMTYKRRVRSAEVYNKVDHLVATIDAELEGENEGGAVSVRQYLQRLIQVNEEANVNYKHFEERGYEEDWRGWAKEWVDGEGALHLRGQMWSAYN